MIPRLVLSDEKGNIYVHPKLKMMGQDAQAFVCLQARELISLPKDSGLFYMPGHSAVGWDASAQMPVRVRAWQDREVFPVAALMIPGFTRLYLPAAEKTDKDIVLPLWPYTAVGYEKGRFFVAAFRIDTMRRQRPFYYKDISVLKNNIGKLIGKYPKNRLFRHLAHCALTYNCRNAQNLFFGRWEAPLPISPACNARCLGCLSYQDTDCAQASHERIGFVPTIEEVCQTGLHHLRGARQPMVSFGQGCEGEPLLQFDLLKESIRRMRQETRRGRIHLNTNGFSASRLEVLARAGLDSVRISVNSLDEERYRTYYRPRGYGLQDVLRSIRMAKKCGLFVSVNLLAFPGYTDMPDEVLSWEKLLKEGSVDLLQMRNLSIDPHYFRKKMPLLQKRPMGMLRMIHGLKKCYSRIRLGYFNPDPR